MVIHIGGIPAVTMQRSRFQGAPQTKPTTKTSVLVHSSWSESWASSRNFANVGQAVTTSDLARMSEPPGPRSARLSVPMSRNQTNTM